MQETQEMWVWSLGQEDPLEEEMATPVLPGKSHGQRSLAGCSPESHKDGDMPEHTCMALYVAQGANICWEPVLSLSFTDMRRKNNFKSTHSCYYSCDVYKAETPRSRRKKSTIVVVSFTFPLSVTKKQTNKGKLGAIFKKWPALFIRLV